MSRRPEVFIAPLDPDTASDVELRGAHAIAVAIRAEEIPEDDPMPFEEWIDDVRITVSFRRRTRWIARESAVDGPIVGYAWMQEDFQHNPNVVWSQVSVLPTHRRQGIGTALLRELVTTAQEFGRTSILADVVEHDPAGNEFLARYGLTPRIREHHNRLLLAEVDRDMLRDWVERALDRAAGYDLVTWDGPTPGELVEQFAPFSDVMNTAPTEELDWEDSQTTPERVRERDAARAAMGFNWWTALAVERETGEFAGYTQLFFPKHRTDVAFQGDTGVDPRHRNKGIGRWIKAWIILRLLAERPEVEKVDTGNAGSNEPMLGINHALGFKPRLVWVGHQSDLDVVAKALAEVEVHHE